MRSVIREAYPTNTRAKVSAGRIGEVTALVSWAVDEGLPLEPPHEGNTPLSR
ncbi:hypothetical protein [Antrihabitans sp. YC2-6]|uniref:hypothetical protein n=1 Tax=Antrihabitans sp. YC2-6 TaxID=2799498 RepID=UPI0018F779AA|nr:hypothetical protein [Antrihabitans sp. YC2-6]MBJ8348670.1 hypothetical protein [Antrihabitans sp. YC2-6]